MTEKEAKRGREKEKMCKLEKGTKGKKSERDKECGRETKSCRDR